MKKTKTLAAVILSLLALISYTGIAAAASVLPPPPHAGSGAYQYAVFQAAPDETGVYEVPQDELLRYANIFNASQSFDIKNGSATLVMSTTGKPGSYRAQARGYLYMYDAAQNKWQLQDGWTTLSDDSVTKKNNFAYAYLAKSKRVTAGKTYLWETSHGVKMSAAGDYEWVYITSPQKKA